MTGQPDRTFNATTIFLLGLLVAASGVVSPAVVLVGGVVFGFSVEHPLRRQSSHLANLVLQASLVGLGFGMNLQQVIRAGRSGFVYTAVRIVAAISLGLVIGRVLRIGGKASFLRGGDGDLGGRDCRDCADSGCG